MSLRRGAPVGFLVGVLGASLIFGAVQLANNPALFFQTFMKSMGLGSVYALIALGFVLIFKATQTVNFAQGALAATGALFVCFLVTDGHIPFTSIANPINSIGGPGWVRWILNVVVALAFSGRGRPRGGASGHPSDDRRAAVLGGGDHPGPRDRLQGVQQRRRRDRVPAPGHSLGGGGVHSRRGPDQLELRRGHGGGGGRLLGRVLLLQDAAGASPCGRWPSIRRRPWPKA